MSFDATTTFPSLCPSATAFKSIPFALAFMASSIRTEAPSIFPAFNASIRSVQDENL